MIDRQTYGQTSHPARPMSVQTISQSSTEHEIAGVTEENSISYSEQ